MEFRIKHSVRPFFPASDYWDTLLVWVSALPSACGLRVAAVILEHSNQR